MIDPPSSSGLRKVTLLMCALLFFSVLFYPGAFIDWRYSFLSVTKSVIRITSFVVSMFAWLDCAYFNFLSLTT